MSQKSLHLPIFQAPSAVGVGGVTRLNGGASGELRSLHSPSRLSHSSLNLTDALISSQPSHQIHSSVQEKATAYATISAIQGTPAHGPRLAPVSSATVDTESELINGVNSASFDPNGAAVLSSRKQQPQHASLGTSSFVGLLPSSLLPSGTPHVSVNLSAMLEAAQNEGRDTPSNGGLLGASHASLSSGTLLRLPSHGGNNPNTASPLVVPGVPPFRLVTGSAQNTPKAGLSFGHKASSSAFAAATDNNPTSSPVLPPISSAISHAEHASLSLLSINRLPGGMHDSLGG